MDESLFIMMLICGFILFTSIIYCFLSSCLGLQIRRSDIWAAFTTPSQGMNRNARGRGRGYEMASPGFGGVGMGGSEEFEMMRTHGPGRGLF